MTPPAQAGLPPKQVPKKVQEIAFFETDILAQLVNRAKQAQQDIQTYCTAVIIRHKGNPAKYAIDGSLQWIVEIPEGVIEAAMRAEIERNKNDEVPPAGSPDCESSEDPPIGHEEKSNVFEMPGHDKVEPEPA